MLARFLIGAAAFVIALFVAGMWQGMRENGFPMGEMLFALIVAVLVALCVGCASVGPVVTNVALNPDGSLQVEKCMVRINNLTGSLEMGQCFSSEGGKRR